ncbi:hypothetical protein BOSE62_130145 [Bosea sp. 62]|nr:hypothetical protein BOSE7B_120147 [Bosea sp. 7B]CAD5279854.1 hypothetical protein BOSE21B_30769 [Bosea sp. 21B]CAD5280979.1 hypothetical protein BOSE46_40406 [Bosea sp. 46]VVT59493.1 hypothetical protein BOS5A_210284 [Bosea sp. EC-HK365B]VXB31094.1 hypothetical protein BOSE62_130145 [Bosea sp. 62]VXB93404.1 hypothetical protein BOSE127_160177 [Bosea sp. 127]VXC35477.1 hypothetical protein BOSE29B_30733 [Bosea sp. 29B]VXC81084.1 hypothetical protein BOSE125_50407 [Bosea sp. 125]
MRSNDGSRVHGGSFHAKGPTLPRVHYAPSGIRLGVALVWDFCYRGAQILRVGRCLTLFPSILQSWRHGCRFSCATTMSIRPFAF